MKSKFNYDKYKILDVTDQPNLWANKDPVRPELDASFRSSNGRRVFALMSEEGSCEAFLCLARTKDIPFDTLSLDEMSNSNGAIAVPYTVWSYKAGAGKEIVNRIIDIADKDSSIDRVITLSPPTSLARRFHLKNEAKELRVNCSTVNFEYRKAGATDVNSG
jgi:hypothetical protein